MIYSLETNLPKPSKEAGEYQHHPCQAELLLSQQHALLAEHSREIPEPPPPLLVHGIENLIALTHSLKLTGKKKIMRKKEKYYSVARVDRKGIA